MTNTNIDIDIGIGADADKFKRALAEKKCFFGFDAFIDEIKKPLYRTDDGKKEYFRSIEQFAEHITSYGGMSKSIEVENKCRKIGGNNPIMSNALAYLGAEVHSVGAYGENEADEIFSKMSKNAKLYPVALPGISISYEFDKCKLMTYTPVDCTKLSYKRIIDELSYDKFEGIVLGADALVLLNYAEMPETLELWYKIAELISQNKEKYACSNERIIFFDLSDITKLGADDVQSAFDAISKFKGMGKVCLSLNENEFNYIYKTFIDSEADYYVISSESRINERLKRILEYTGVELLIFRNVKAFYSIDSSDCFEYAENYYCPNPIVLTGAGDNQNAGVLAGLLCGMPVKQALSLGAATGGYYISHGFGVSGIDDLLKGRD